MAKKQTKKPFHAQVHHHLKQTFVPHKSNHFRPYSVRFKGLAVVLLLVSSCLAASNLAATGDILGMHTNITSTGLLEETNKARSWKGAPPLRLDPQLNQAAYAKAQDMLQYGYWSHVSPSGVKPWKWLTDADYNYGKAGENLARGFTNANTLTDAWMASPEHRSNVLDPDYSDMGIAVVDGEMDGKQTTLVVALYAQPVVRGQVAGVTSFNSASPRGGLLANFGSAIKTLPSAALGSVTLLSVFTIAALVTHAYRKKLPRPIRLSWRRHHGAFAATSTLALAVILFVMYSGGQI